MMSAIFGDQVGETFIKGEPAEITDLGRVCQVSNQGGEIKLSEKSNPLKTGDRVADQLNSTGLENNMIFDEPMEPQPFGYSEITDDKCLYRFVNAKFIKVTGEAKKGENRVGVGINVSGEGPDESHTVMDRMFLKQMDMLFHYRYGQNQQLSGISSGVPARGVDQPLLPDGPAARSRINCTTEPMTVAPTKTDVQASEEGTGPDQGTKSAPLPSKSGKRNLPTIVQNILFVLLEK